MGDVITVYQPHYYPRLHYLARAARADVFVVYDDVKFCRSSPHHRAPIEYQGLDWLTIPVTHTGPRTNITEAVVDLSEPWPATHLATLVGKYGERATALRPFYQNLCVPIADLGELRAQRERGALDVNPSVADRVEDCLERDETWKAQKQWLDELRRRKGAIADRIAARKRSDPGAEIDDLTATANGLEKRLRTVEEGCKATRRRRNELLVEISTAIDVDDRLAHDELSRLWDLSGIDPVEVVPSVRLTEVTIPILAALFDRFAIETTMVRSSDLPVDHPGDASEYLARITAQLDGETFLSGGVGYENYLDEAPFDSRGIDVAVQDWTPTWDDGNVCSLDVVFSDADPERYVTPV